MCDNRRASDSKVLALCPNELRMLYFLGDQVKKEVVTLSTMDISDPAAKESAALISALTSQSVDIVAEMKKKMGVE